MRSKDVDLVKRLSVNGFYKVGIVMRIAIDCRYSSMIEYIGVSSGLCDAIYNHLIISGTASYSVGDSSDIFLLVMFVHLKLPTVFLPVVLAVHFGQQILLDLLLLLLVVARNITKTWC